MLEAGFARACPVAYDIPANRELVISDRGFLVEKGNVSGVITVLKELAKDKSALMRNAVAYQEHILESYNIETFARRMDVIVSEAASEVKKRG